MLRRKVSLFLVVIMIVTQLFTGLSFADVQENNAEEIYTESADPIEAEPVITTSSETVELSDSDDVLLDTASDSETDVNTAGNTDDPSILPDTTDEVASETPNELVGDESQETFIPDIPVIQGTAIQEMVVDVLDVSVPTDEEAMKAAIKDKNDEFFVIQMTDGTTELRRLEKVTRSLALSAGNVKVLSLNECISKYEKKPEVEICEKVEVYRADELQAKYIPSDNYADDPGLWGLQAIKADRMLGWISYSSLDAVKVAVLDTGVDYYHSDLDIARPSVGGYDFYYDDADPMDENGHGTHVAGIIGATANNLTGILGAAGGVRIIPVQVLGDLGYGFSTDIAEGIRWAADHDADVINMSLGSAEPSEIINAAIQYAYGKGVVVVAASGNESNNWSDGSERDTFNSGSSVSHKSVSYPAAFNNVIAVGSVSHNGDTLWVSDFSNSGSELDVVAPGEDILSTLPDENYGYKNGTSMATPYVSALAAMLRAVQPDMSVAAITSRIKDTARDVNDPTYSNDTNYFGAGIVDFVAALSSYVSTPSSDPKLQQIKIDGNDIAGFDPAVLSYAVNTTSTEVTIEPIYAQGQSYKINDNIINLQMPIHYELNSGINEFRIESVAADNVATVVYTLSITCQPLGESPQYTVVTDKVLSLSSKAIVNENTSAKIIIEEEQTGAFDGNSYQLTYTGGEWPQDAAARLEDYFPGYDYNGLAFDASYVRQNGTTVIMTISDYTNSGTDTGWVEIPALGVNLTGSEWAVAVKQTGQSNGFSYRLAWRGYEFLCAYIGAPVVIDTTNVLETLGTLEMTEPSYGELQSDVRLTINEPGFAFDITGITVETDGLLPGGSVYNGGSYIEYRNLQRDWSSTDLASVRISGLRIKATTAGTASCDITTTVSASGSTGGNGPVLGRYLTNYSKLGDINFLEGSLSPAFNPSTTTYALSLPHTANAVSLQVTRGSEFSKVLYQDEPLPLNVPTSIPLSYGSNAVDLVVLADSGVARTYHINITREDPGTNGLKELTLARGVLSPVFQPSILNYSTTLGYGENTLTLEAVTAYDNATVTINGAAYTSGSTYNSPLTVGLNTFIISVRDTLNAVRNYTLTATRQAADGGFDVTVPEYSEIDFGACALGYINIDETKAGAHSQFFSPVFTATLPAGYHWTTAPTIHLSGAFNGCSATVEINGRVLTVTPDYTNALTSIKGNMMLQGGAIAADSGTALGDVGLTFAGEGFDNELTTIATYSGYYLSDMAFGGVVLTPAFDSYTRTYVATVPSGSSTVALTAIAEMPGATLKVNGVAAVSGIPKTLELAYGDNTINVVATGNNGQTRQYTTVIHRISNDADLTGLSIGGATLSPGFQKNVMEYQTVVDLNTSTVNLQATRSDSNTVMKVNGEAYTNNTSKAIALAAGANVVTVGLTAEEGNSKTYTITIYREDATLSGLTLEKTDDSEVALSPSFNKNTMEYGAVVDSDVVSVELISSKTDANAVLKLNGSVINSGESQTINLVSGANRQTILVTAPSGAVKTYVLNVIRKEQLPAVAPAQPIVVDDADDNRYFELPPVVATGNYSFEVDKAITDAFIDLGAPVGDALSISAQLNFSVKDNGNQIADIKIPEGVTVRAAGGNSWDGALGLPEIKSSTQADLGGGTANKIVEVGMPDFELSFDKPVRILLPGMAGKTVKWYRTGTAATEITKVLSADTEATAIAELDASNREGKVTVGSDLVIWTTHFTEFVAFTPAPASSGGRSSGGGGGGGGASGADIVVKTNETSILNLDNLTVTFEPNTYISEFQAAANKVGYSFSPFKTGQRQLSNIFNLTKNVDGAVDKPMRVEFLLKMKDVKLVNERVAMFYLDTKTNKWFEHKDTIFDPATGKVSAMTKLFTEYAVIAVSDVAVVQEPVAQGAVSVALTDIAGHWAVENIKKLVDRKAIFGNPDGTFQPDKQITRAEFVAILVKALNLNGATDKSYKDLNGHWAAGVMQVAIANGVVTGYEDGTIRPDALITREQMAVMIAKASKLSSEINEQRFSDQSEIAEWARMYVLAAVKKGIISGYSDNTFKPQNLASKAEAVTMIIRSIN